MYSGIGCERCGRAFVVEEGRALLPSLNGGCPRCGGAFEPVELNDFAYAGPGAETPRFGRNGRVGTEPARLYPPPAAPR